MIEREMMMRLSWWLLWVAMGVMVAVVAGGGGEANVSEGNEVTYDGRSLIIGGQRKILFSGSIHYPRSTPQMWPSLIRKAKEGGIDVIQTYVFWNQHEPQHGQYNFEGKNDLVRFIKEIQAQGLYATLRIGPFIEAEWTYGGLPFWLHDIPGIVYRSDNEPFKYYMQNFTTKIVDLMKSENLYASQGGPIILSQIENEYKNVEASFHEKGPPYVKWAAKMAVDQQTGVPWVMCKQDDAPDPVINACNGRQCGETFVGPNSPNKPAIWTENWTSFYQAFGQEPLIRSAEDIAYHVALFIVKKRGSYINYYMYHGGTNLGRTGSPYVTTSYYDQAPLDEYGLIRQPKWGHLKELHAAVKLVSETLLFGKVNYEKLGEQQEAYVYQGNSGDCAAFLLNNNKMHSTTLNFRNMTYQMSRSSIIILKDCKDEIFNTGKVSAQFSTRSMELSQKLDVVKKWQTYREANPNFADTQLKANDLLEHMATTEDSSDYLWYTFSFQHRATGAKPVLRVLSLGHVVHAYVNNRYVGYAHGNITTKNFTLEHEISFNHGTNNVTLLSAMFGLPDGGGYLEKRVAGIRKVLIEGTGQGTHDFSKYTWGYQVGLLGEKLELYTNEGLNKVQWGSFESAYSPLTWYKAVFDAPQGDDPVVLNLESMSKGEAWVNGQSIGRYWSSFNTSKGNPSQSLYHVPRSFLEPSGNLLVLLEEVGGNPLNVSVGTISTNRVCGHVSDSHRLLSDQLKQSGSLKRQRPVTQLECPSGMTVSKIVFASFGNPHGDCSNYTMGSCHSANSKTTVEKACLEKNQCSITQSIQNFGEDPCPRISKSLKIEAQCG